MSVVYCALLLCLTFFGRNAADKQNKIEISLYYDSLSPDTKLLFEEHLKPIVGFNNVTLQLFPNGKATYIFDGRNKTYVFTCPNGEVECFTNMVHTCTLRPSSPNDSFKQHRVTKDQFNFLLCLVGKGKNVSVDAQTANVQSCGMNSSVNADDVLQCAKGPDGTNLQTVVRSITTTTENVFKEDKIPLIIVNQEATAEMPRFKEMVCENLKIEDGCSGADLATFNLLILSFTLALCKIIY